MCYTHIYTYMCIRWLTYYVCVYHIYIYMYIYTYTYDDRVEKKR